MSDEPLLGLATTRQLLEELAARGRCETHYEVLGSEMAMGAARLMDALPESMLEYRTAGGEGVRLTGPAYTTGYYVLNCGCTVHVHGAGVNTLRSVVGPRKECPRNGHHDGSQLNDRWDRVVAIR